MGNARLWGSEPQARVRPAPSAPAAGTPVDIPFVIAAEAGILAEATEWEPHEHPVHELVWVRRGVMKVQIGNRVWALPSQVGLWIPAGVRHGGSVAAGTQFQASFFAPALSVFSPDQPTTINISTLLHELLMHLARTDLSGPARSRAEQTVFDLLEPSGHPLGLPLPEDGRIAPIARYLADNPHDRRTLDDWAGECGVSSRTLARVFVASTGQTFAQWRQMLRIHVSLTLLSSGYPVEDVGEAVGYLRTSSFIVAFTAAIGVTPGRYRSRELSGSA